jgi:sugar phosphate isomerase/epimerase
MKVSVSISDLPILQKLDYLFAGLKNAGADGIEIVTGVKSRWNWERLAALANEYDLPVTSAHQPPWSALNLYFDERYVARALSIGIKNFVYHPLPRYPFADRHTVAYFERLSSLRKEYGVNIMLENMPSVFRRSFAKQLMPLNSDTWQVEKFIPVLEKYDLNFNLDISHVFLPELHREPWFDKIFPRMRNIHLSSFRPGRDHLPLYLGDFKTKEFIQVLKKKKYDGLITLEIFYPRMVRFNNYDFGAIKQSIELVKSI